MEISEMLKEFLNENIELFDNYEIYELYQLLDEDPSFDSSDTGILTQVFLECGIDPIDS